MLFPTIDFAIFFAVVFTVNWLLNPFPGLWKPAMVVASYLFYSWWNWRFVFLLAAVTVLAVVGGSAIARFEDDRRRRIALVLSVLGLLGLLGWFKYYGFVVVSLDNVLHALGAGHHPLPLLDVTLPVGISFFTFMALSYVIDVYRGRLQPARPVDLAVYLSFFPHLVAGPIVRGDELLPQIRRRRDPEHIDIGRAFWLITAGLFKKVVVSSCISSWIVNPVFEAPHSHSSQEILFAIYGYAVQIYADFSGYTDIAIGVALLLGFQFPVNFDGPYTATNLQDFWRRWHITLSRWLRDYLYVPLGGSRGEPGVKGRTLVARNIMITMVLGGLWHGAAWTFVAWGAIHGVGQVVGHWRRAMRESRGCDPVATGPACIWVQRILTFHIVCFGWLFFRSDSFSVAFTMIVRLFTSWGPAPLVTPLVALMIAGSIASQYVSLELVERAQALFSRQRPALQGSMLAAALLAITTLGPQGVAPFIYFRF